MNFPLGSASDTRHVAPTREVRSFVSGAFYKDRFTVTYNCRDPTDHALSSVKFILGAATAMVLAPQLRQNLSERPIS
jgi:hypothetical protein